MGVVSPHEEHIYVIVTKVRVLDHDLVLVVYLDSHVQEDVYPSS